MKNKVESVGKIVEKHCCPRRCVMKTKSLWQHLILHLMYLICKHFNYFYPPPSPPHSLTLLLSFVIVVNVCCVCFMFICLPNCSFHSYVRTVASFAFLFSYFYVTTTAKRVTQRAVRKLLAATVVVACNASCSCVSVSAAVSATVSVSVTVTVSLVYVSVTGQGESFSVFCILIVVHSCKLCCFCCC